MCISHPKTSVPSFLIPNWAFWIPPLSCTISPLLTTFPRQELSSVSKKPPFCAYRHFFTLAVSDTCVLRRCWQPPWPPGSRTETVLRGSLTTVMWPYTHLVGSTDWERSETNALETATGDALPVWAGQVSWVTLPWTTGWQSLTCRWECGEPCWDPGE